jgi:eukaryotic-like serine/threonine-protein kinase
MAPVPPESVSDGEQLRCIPITVPSVLVQRYELGPLVGQGGSAHVHWAWDRLLNRAVAVKLFAPGVAEPDRNRQDHELTALKRLVHPGLVQLFEAGADHGRTYLVMRLAQGPSLADRLRDMPLPVAEVAELGAQVADTLAYVHANGVTHRDIKPANVLLDEQDGALLADFGIALLVDCTRVTLSGAVIGTAAYMAPEQVRGELVGPPADMYSLGLVLLEALTGRREYPGTSVESACARLHRAPDVPENLPVGLTYILRRMIAIEPAERPSSAAAASALQVAVTELGGSATVRTDLLTQLLDESAFRPAAAPGRLRRRIVLAGAASTVLLAAGLTGLTTLDPTSGGATGITSLLPSIATVFPAHPTELPVPSTGAAGSAASGTGLPDRTAIGPTPRGATGITNPPPTIATGLPAHPSGAAGSAAPGTGVPDRTAIGPSPDGAIGTTSPLPITATAPPAPSTGLTRFVAPPAALRRVPLLRGTPPAGETSSATPPPVKGKPVPQVDAPIPTPAIPPQQYTPGMAAPAPPHSRTPGDHGNGTSSASGHSGSDLGAGSPAADISRHR